MTCFFYGTCTIEKKFVYPWAIGFFFSPFFPGFFVSAIDGISNKRRCAVYFAGGVMGDICEIISAQL